MGTNSIRKTPHPVSSHWETSEPASDHTDLVFSIIGILTVASLLFVL